VPATLKQNDRLVAVPTVTAEHAGGRVLLVDRLPAGLEIENPKLVDGGSVAGLSWLKTTIVPEHTEFRDDRFVAAFNLFNTKRGRHPSTNFTAAYMVRAVSAGTFAHPAATVEDMYRPELRAQTASSELTIASQE